MNRDIQGSRQKHSNRDTGTGTWTGKEWDRNTDRDRWTQTGLSLAKPDPSIARGSSSRSCVNCNFIVGWCKAGGVCRNR